jgi:hypothetical protein
MRRGRQPCKSVAGTSLTPLRGAEWITLTPGRTVTPARMNRTPCAGAGWHFIETRFRLKPTEPLGLGRIPFYEARAGRSEATSCGAGCRGIWNALRHEAGFCSDSRQGRRFFPTDQNDALTPMKYDDGDVTERPASATERRTPSALPLSANLACQSGACNLS